MAKILFISLATLLIWPNLSSRAQGAGPTGQEGNGGFVYKDKERSKKADIIIDNGLDELVALATAASESVFADLKPSVNKQEFIEMIKNYVVRMPSMMDYRPTPNGGGIALMMDYKTDDVGTKYIVVYAPMFVALMYMEDQAAAQKFFETQLIHEVLHHFSYGEAEADVAAPALYERLKENSKK